jgi:hypothetical protein
MGVPATLRVRSFGFDGTPGLGSASSAVFGRIDAAENSAGRVDEPDVGVGLRKIAELAPRARIELLREEPDIVAERKQMLEGLRRLFALLLEGGTSASQNVQSRNARSPASSPSASGPVR